MQLYSKHLTTSTISHEYLPFDQFNNDHVAVTRKLAVAKHCSATAWNTVVFYYGLEIYNCSKSKIQGDTR